MLRRSASGVVVALFAAASIAIATTPLRAQQRPTPTDDVIEQIRRAVNDLRYPEAIRLGRQLEQVAGQLRPSQVVWLRQLLALAYYPEERDVQRPDSAMRQLEALVRVRPDVELFLEYRWTGLDSLLSVARGRIFAFTISPEPEYVLGGDEPNGLVGVFTTRTAFVRVAVVNRTSGRTIPQDSGLVRERSSVRLRAHRDGMLLLESGEYDLRAVATDMLTQDSVVVERRFTATVPPITLVALPALDSTRFLPELRRPERWRTIVTGTLAGVATAAMGSLVRGGEALSGDFPSDTRAIGLGGAIALGAVGLAFADRGAPIPENARANAKLRADHAAAVAAARAENARLLAPHRATLRFAPEVP